MPSPPCQSQRMKFIETTRAPASTSRRAMQKLRTIRGAPSRSKSGSSTPYLPSDFRDLPSTGRARRPTCDDVRMPIAFWANVIEAVHRAASCRSRGGIGRGCVRSGSRSCSRSSVTPLQDHVVGLASRCLCRRRGGTVRAPCRGSRRRPDRPTADRRVGTSGSRGRHRGIRRCPCSLLTHAPIAGQPPGGGCSSSCGRSCTDRRRDRRRCRRASG